jgi:cephalosporin hydroxylase
MISRVEAAISDAWDVGRRFNLDDCLYGIPHWAGDPPVSPYPYYFFLAGLAASQQCRRALEIGTHMGGSTLAIRKGMGDGLERFVTLDTTDLSDPLLAHYPEIEKLQGSAGDPAIISRIVEMFNGNNIDILYIDAFHDYEHTISHYGIFSILLRPKITVFDDIFLNLSMKRMWFDIRRSAPHQVADTTLVSNDIRNIDAGFGVRLVDESLNEPAPRFHVPRVSCTPFQTTVRAVDPVSLSNPTEQAISFRACWNEAREHFAPIIRMGVADALHPPDRRLCVFADTVAGSVYVSTFAQETGKEIVCVTPSGTFPRGQTCEISVRASTALGYLEIELDKTVTKAWWEVNGRMCVAEPRILIGASSSSVTVEQIELSRFIL